MTAKRIYAVVLGVVLMQSAHADYFEVRRTAYVYQEPDRHSTVLQHFELTSSSAEIRLAIVGAAPVDGYLQVQLTNGTRGWIYKSRGRAFPGAIPGAAPTPGNGSDEEIAPDITPGVVPPVDNGPLDPVTDVGLEIYVFDIGQADSMLLVGPPPARKTVLIDLGEELNGSGTNYTQVRDRIRAITGRSSVNYFVLTHFHEDHAGYPGRGSCTHATAQIRPTGVFALLADTQNPFRIDTWLDRGDDHQFTPKISRPHCGVMQAMNGWIANGRVGQRLVPTLGSTQIELGAGITIDVLAVDGKTLQGDAGAMAEAEQIHGDVMNTSHPGSENDYSVAMEISVGNFEMFTAGDLTGAPAAEENETHTIRRFGDSATVYTNVERYILRHWQQIGRESEVEVYRASHHGSGHSSSPAFAARLDPAVVIYSTGGDYGHPDPTIVNRFAKAEQYVTTRVSAEKWPNGLPANRGTIVGEVRILVARDGSRYQVNDHVYRSLTDTQEAQD